MNSSKYFLEKNQPVHIISRAVAGIKIFKSKEDCFRFIYYLYVANIGSPARNLRKGDVKKIAEAILRGREILSKFIIDPHPSLVYFLDFTTMQCRTLHCGLHQHTSA